MSNDWESAFKKWAQPPGSSEQERCDNAATMVRNAVRASARLKLYDLRVFPQGSYPNRTNVRQDSDVDVCVCLMDTLRSDFQFAKGFTREDVGLIPATYSYKELKELERKNPNHQIILFAGKSLDEAYDRWKNKQRRRSERSAP